jgi:DNA-binding transcriptional LysR family regulator
MITLKTLAAVQAVLETGSVTAAAQKLALAQSVVSAHFANFQGWFDYPIFKLGSRTAIPTLAGEETLRCMRAVLLSHTAFSTFSRGVVYDSSSRQTYEAQSITLKQLETFYWLMKLGSVISAANKLNITQAAASRRLQEFAARCQSPLFVNPRHKTDLTPFGQQCLERGEAVLTAYANLKSRRVNDRVPDVVLHIGMTELVALTWFPAFAQRLRAVYPHIMLHPDVDISTSLQEKLLSSRLDVALIPGPSVTPAMTCVEMGSTSFSWFCAPGTFGHRKRASLSALASKPLLVQGRGSGLTPVALKLFASAGLAPHQIFGSNSLVALAGLIESGIGVSCLPSALFADLVRQGRLQVIESTTPPKASYFFAFLKRHPQNLYSLIADIAKETCRF